MSENEGSKPCKHDLYKCWQCGTHPRDCEHGSLRRSCEICELKNELSEANEIKESQYQSFQEWKKDYFKEREKLLAEIEEHKNRHLAWTKYFQETQLSHVSARFDSLKAQLAAANKELEEQSRLLGMSGEREAKLRTEIERLKTRPHGPPFSACYAEDVVKGKDAIIAQQKAEIETIKGCDHLDKPYRKLLEENTRQREVIEVYREALEAMSKGLFSTRNAKVISQQAIESARKLNAKENR